MMKRVFAACVAMILTGPAYAAGGGVSLTERD